MTRRTYLNERQAIGRMSVDEFRNYMDNPGGRPYSRFLEALIEEFNAGKERIGEPERFRSIIRGIHY